MKAEARVRFDEVDPGVRKKFREYFVIVSGYFSWFMDDVYWFFGEREDMIKRL